MQCINVQKMHFSKSQTTLRSLQNINIVQVNPFWNKLFCGCKIYQNLLNTLISLFRNLCSIVTFSRFIICSHFILKKKLEYFMWKMKVSYLRSSYFVVNYCITICTLARTNWFLLVRINFRLFRLTLRRMHVYYVNER